MVEQVEAMSLYDRECCDVCGRRGNDVQYIVGEDELLCRECGGELVVEAFTADNTVETDVAYH